MSSTHPSPYALSRGAELTASPLTHEYATRLGAAPQAVFAFITDFPRIPEWMPLISRVSVDDSEAEVQGQVGAVRVIEPPLGPTTRERVVAFEPGRLLAYAATDASLMGMFRNHLGVLTTEPHPLGGTHLTWLSHGSPGTLPMRLLGRFIFRFVIGRSMRALEKKFPCV